MICRPTRLVPIPNFSVLSQPSSSSNSNYVFCHSLTPYPMQNIDPLGIGTNRGFLGKVFGITWLPFFPLKQMLWRLKIDIKLKIS